MASDYELLVVGGGPAGLTAAQTAASHGVRTLVVERQAEIGYPVHTSGGSWIDHMGKFAIPDHLYNPVHQIVFISPTQERSFHYKISSACVVDVRKLYQYIAACAVESGAEIRVKHTAERFLLKSDRVVGISVKNHLGARSEISAEIVIDASGFSRNLAVRAGLTKPYYSYAFCAEYEFHAPHCDQETVYFLVGRTIAPFGYGWVFPCGNSRIRVGVGVIHPECRDDAREYLNRIVELPRLRKELKNSSPIEFHTGLFPVCAPLTRLSTHGLMFVGDAGGQNSQFIGEGIRFAMQAGRIAGEVVAEAIHSRQNSANFLQEYDRRWKSRYGSSLWLGHKAGRLLMSNDDEQWDVMLNYLGCLTTEQLEKFIRSDFSLSLLATVAIRQLARPANWTRTLRFGLQKGESIMHGNR